MPFLNCETQGVNTYLVYQIDETDALDTMSLGMLTNNKIPNVAQTQFLQIDTAKYLKYNVSSKVSLRQFFSGPVNKKRLLGVLSSMVEGCLAAEEYMIDINSMLFDLDYIYADVSSNEAFLICLPVCNTEMRPVDLGGFFKSIMFTTQFDQSENCDHVARIINVLNGSPIFSLQEFKTLLNQIKNEVPAASAARPAAPQPAKVAAPVQQKETQPRAAEPVKVNPAVSPKAEISIPTPAPAAAPEAPAEKKISMMELLRHYNKENAAAYKAQQAAKKNAAAAAKQEESAKRSKKEKEKKSQPVAGFAIPGQSPVDQPVVQPAPQAAAKPEPQAAPQPVVSRPAAPVAYVPPQVPQGQDRNFGETVCLGGGASLGTMVLGVSQTPEQQAIPYLIRAKNNEKILLNKANFRIGKESTFVDYFIGDNPAVSRSHACFITREDEYFVMDTNSTNHTYVNGERLQSNVEFKLSHGDKVRLGNEEFEFKIY